MSYFKLLRFPNLAMIAIIQAIVQYAVLPYFPETSLLSNGQFALLVTATILIAGGGYIINDYCDRQTDAINKPEKVVVGITLSRKRTRYYYLVITLIGILSGWLLAYLTDRITLGMIFFGISVSLWLYARYLKGVAIVGNVLVSMLVAMTILIVWVFSIPIVLDAEILVTTYPSFQFIWHISIFAFTLNALRELVKDIQDVHGDYVSGYKTLPILLGRSRTAKITAAGCLATLTLIAWYGFTFLMDAKILLVALFVTIVAPLGYLSHQLWEAETAQSFGRISFLLKIIMCIGMLLVPFIVKNIFYA